MKGTVPNTSATPAIQHAIFPNDALSFVVPEVVALTTVAAEDADEADNADVVSGIYGSFFIIRYIFFPAQWVQNIHTHTIAVVNLVAITAQCDQITPRVVRAIAVAVVNVSRRCLKVECRATVTTSAVLIRSDLAPKGT